MGAHSKDDAGRRRAIDGIGRDVAERRAAAAELNALRRVATLVANGVQPLSLFALVAEEQARRATGAKSRRNDRAGGSATRKESRPRLGSETIAARDRCSRSSDARKVHGI